VDTAKPDPEVIGVALDRADAQPSEAVLIGDSTWDMIAARRAGVTALGLRCGGSPDAALLDAGAGGLFDDPADLLDHLDEVLGTEQLD
jgi:phosphoglycolate phosphatase-like HAD superfamily hydrolase